MKLYAFECARLITPDGHIFGKNNTAGYKLLLPVPAFLAVHEKEGLVLFDTGINTSHVPDIMKADISTSPYFRIEAHLERLGYSAAEVRHVVLSHLHFDHSGRIADFPGAVFHIRQSELEAAQNPSRSDYITADYECLSRLRVDQIPDDNDYDLFGDGTVVCLDTKGHSAGHQSFLINLPKSGQILLAVDAAHMRTFFEDDTLLNESWNKGLAMQAIERIKCFERQGAFVVLGHDPDQWADLKKLPQYYD